MLLSKVLSVLSTNWRDSTAGQIYWCNNQRLNNKLKNVFLATALEKIPHASFEAKINRLLINSDTPLILHIVGSTPPANVNRKTAFVHGHHRTLFLQILYALRAPKAWAWAWAEDHLRTPSPPPLFLLAFPFSANDAETRQTVWEKHNLPCEDITL